MPSLTLKNIPDDLYALLKQSAALHLRSLNSEILVCIERAVRSQRLSTEDVLATARRLREWTADYSVDDETIDKAKREGRP